VEKEIVIQMEGLTKRYGAQTAVDHLSLEVAAGEVFGFLGPNGAGKTTTMLMLLGLTEPTSGLVRVCGFDPAREPLKVKEIIGYLPENVGFYEDMDARQNLRYIARLTGSPTGSPPGGSTGSSRRSTWPRSRTRGWAATPKGCASASGSPRSWSRSPG
jgi:ABC-type multidrug transport system ATPase subunit